MTAVADRLLEAIPPRAVAEAMAKLAERAIEQIERSLPRALAGDPSQVRLYVDAYRVLSERAIETVEAARPDLLLSDRQHHLILVEAKHSKGKSPQPEIPWMKSMLAGEAMRAPFSQWVGHFGAGRGTAVAIVALLREALPGTKPLSVPARHRLPAWDVKDTDVVRFYRAVSETLEGGEAPLERVRSVLSLSRTDLAGLFGVKRQALERWDTHGVPADRQKKVATLGAIVDLLTAQLKADRIPGVVRRRALAYGNRSILEAIAAGDEEAVLGELRSTFDWASAA